MRDPITSYDAVPTEERHAALRRDIRLVVSLLGEELARVEGHEFLDLVEQIRGVARLEWSEGEPAGGGLAEQLPNIPTGTALLLARAFAAYFQLANVTEQVHRAAELGQARRAERTFLRDTLDRIAEHRIDSTSARRDPGAPRVPSCVHAHTRPSRRAARSCRSCSMWPTSSKASVLTRRRRGKAASPPGFAR